MEMCGESKMGVNATLAQKAVEFASMAHENQTRADGQMYITHPVAVAELVREFKTSNDIDALVAAAYLHDTVEDTNTTIEDITEMFGVLVASLVAELTSDENGNSFKSKGKSQYLQDKMVDMSSWALVIKLADRLHNVSNFNGGKSHAWGAKYKKQTQDIIANLEHNRDLTATHKNMINAITEKLNEFDG